MLFTDSTGATISRFAYDLATSALSQRTIIHRAADALPPSRGIPDGLTMDLAANLWSARWGGASVLRLRFDGTPLDAIELPTKNVTSVAFGGADWRTLFITTAGGPVYACEAGVAGRPEFRSDIRPG
jgi:D-xylonolactonase